MGERGYALGLEQRGQGVSPETGLHLVVGLEIKAVFCI